MVSSHYSLPPRPVPLDQFVTTSQVNIRILGQIALNKAEPRITLKKVERLVYQAALQVLGDIKPYLMGAKTLNEKQIRQIEEKFEKLNLTAQKKKTHLAKKAHLLMNLISNLRERSIQALADMNQIQADMKIRADMNQIRADYYQIMGCVVAYSKWKRGDRINAFHPELPDYQIHEVIKNSRGLQIVVLTPMPTPNGHPPIMPMPPIVCCRGTLASNPHNIIDDMHKHIGQYSFQESKDKIARVLKGVSENHGAAVLTGHSLGGAIVQAMVAEYCDCTNDSGNPLIQSAYHFNAPGVGKKVVKEYKKKRQKMPEERRPKVISYHHASDIVCLAGGSHLRADERYEIGKYALFMSAKAAHSFHQLISKIGIKRVDTHFSIKRKCMKFISEKVRGIISFIAKWVFVSKVKKQQKHTTIVKAMLAFTKATSDERSQQIAAYHQEQQGQRTERVKGLYQAKAFA